MAWADWNYTTSIPRDQLNTAAGSNAATYLLFNGLDTIADIWFCGQKVASTDNQFRQYYFDVSAILQSCPTGSSPELLVQFFSAPGTAAYLASQPGAETWPLGVEGLFEFSLTSDGIGVLLSHRLVYGKTLGLSSYRGKT